MVTFVVVVQDIQGAGTYCTIRRIGELILVHSWHCWVRSSMRGLPISHNFLSFGQINPIKENYCMPPAKEAGKALVQQGLSRYPIITPQA